MRYFALVPFGTLLIASLAFAGANPPGQVKAPTLSLPELHGPAKVLRDVDGVPHVYAVDEHDALFLQGWLQAQDRLFQIDVLRRQAAGTLAEIVGTAALNSDVELRTIGLGRAAQRSLNAYSPAVLAGLQAYADGVNAWVSRNPLPAQYAALELTEFQPWTPLDSALIGKALAFSLSFDIDVNATLDYLQYQAVLGSAGGFAAFFGDVFRSAPFDPAASVPDAGSSTAATQSRFPRQQDSGYKMPGGRAFQADKDLAKRLRQIKQRYDAIPFLRRTMNRTNEQIGSNEWAVSGSLTKSGRPLVSNDPHLGLDLPATFYQIHLTGKKEGLDAIGSSIAGTPYVVLGQNRYITWGETTTGFDVTDTYQEKVQALGDDPATGLPRFVTYYMGQPEPVDVMPASFRANVIGDGKTDNLVTAYQTVILTVPRRNNGPIIDLQVDPSTGAGSAISVQYTGFSGTRELESFRLANYARNLDDFVAALQYFDAGSQNFIYGDIDGNTGYFTTGEIPLREDLQANTINGAPPWFIRNGQGGNEWLTDPDPDELNGTGYLSLPFNELPQAINPSSGRIVNANNDPAGVTLDNDPVNQLRKSGQGIYFIGYSFAPGLRAGRITRALDARLADGPVDRNDMQAVQANVQLLDAEVLTPYILDAFDNATAPGAPGALQALAADPRVSEAVARLKGWDYSTPTGVAGGYDSSDINGQLMPPTSTEISHSISATIYSVWRAKAIANGVDLTLDSLGLPRPGSSEAVKALRHLMERDGIGLSTIDFFGWAAAVGLDEPADRRDFVALKSLADALDSLAGPDFADAFVNSTDQDDYRWGRLHRIVFDGLVVDGAFSIPGATAEYPPSFDDLPGLATDGGFGAVDASSHSARASSSNAFMFGSGPNRRYVGIPGTAPGSIDAETALPGGMSGVLGNKFYANLLGAWLTNDAYPLRVRKGEVMQNLDSQQMFKPDKKAD